MQQYVVVAFREGEPDRQCVVEGGDCIIGRTLGADLILPDSTISRRHATIRVGDDHVLIEDHESTNGVFVNGEQVKQSTIHEGDFLTVGAYTVVLRGLDAAETAAPPRGRTLCLGYDSARKLHDESLERRIPQYFPILYKAAVLLGERLPLEELLQRVLSLVVDSMPVRRGAIVILTGDLRKPKVAARFPLENKASEAPLSNTFMDHVLRTRTAVLTENAQVDPRFSSSETVLRHAVGPAICVPLCGGGPLCGAGGAVGVLYVDASRGATAFEERELEFLAVLGHVVGMVVANRQLDEEVAKQNRLAALGHAIAGVSHDVRNVLTGIKGGVQILESGRTDKKEIALACDIVHKAADKMEAYLTDLLLFARQTEIERAATAVNSLIEDVIGLVRSRADERSVQLAFQGGGFEPASIDGNQIHRVLLNLVTNAVEACRGNEGVVTISVGRRDDALMLQVRDTGAGIAEGDIPRLSEPFFSTKGSGGTGLGLAISYRIVEQHGGKILVTSKVGEGSTFTVVLPNSFPRATVAHDTDPRTVVPDGSFRTCPGCGFVWHSQDTFLSDANVSLSGYQVHFDELGAGRFIFNHTCGTVLALPASDFRHLYGGEIFEECLTGSDQCPGFCLHKHELGPCPAQCACAYVREVLQLIRNWPKNNP